MVKTVAISQKYHTRLMELARGQKLGRTIELLIDEKYALKNNSKAKTKQQEAVR